MKITKIYCTLFLTLALLLIPVLSATDKEPIAVSTLVKTDETEDTVKLKKSDGTISEISTDDYLFSVVGAEMPALYEAEALKAQAVASYTFLLYRKEENKKEDFDITDTPYSDQSFKTEEELKELWGDKYTEYADKITSVIKEVKGEKITYKGKIALPLYFAVSAGKTESAKNVFGTDIPYLVPVESIGDMLSPDYLNKKTFTFNEIREAFSGVSLSEDTSAWFSNPVYSESGTLLSADFGDTSLSGSEIRTFLSLNSANISAEFSEDGITLTTKGKGHLVGMSQNGANYMAKQGSNYKEILTRYYPDCEIS